MIELSVLVGGKAGDGINEAGMIISRILNQLGYRLYQYLDYQSLIRGGHNFSIVRASKDKIAAHKDKVNFLLALNQETIDFHEWRLEKDSFVIYNADEVKTDQPGCFGLPLKEIIKETGAPTIARNSILIGGFCKIAGIEWEVLETIIRREVPRDVDLNLKVARQGYDSAEEKMKMKPLRNNPLPVITGNEIIGLGLIKGGLDAYVAYPMTPSSGVLHFLAHKAEDFSLKVVHPENEIATILMAQGFAYVGERVACGTSGGGFCLMHEGLSLAGMAEMPVVVVVSQRVGPSTGVPTYTAQGDLHFVMNAGQGEFTRLVIAPGDAEQAYFWSATALALSWKYQVPTIILSDKTLSESAYSFDLEAVEEPKEAEPVVWEGGEIYQRYLRTNSGVSPLAFPPNPYAIVKVNSYAHLESGITTEDASEICSNQDKSLRKEEALIKELNDYPSVNVYGDLNSSTALLCWGSNKGVCAELGHKYHLRVVQPVVLNPFPIQKFEKAFFGVKKTICVEGNSTGQLARLMRNFNLQVDEKILKYDGRPFSIEYLDDKLREVTK